MSISTKKKILIADDVEMNRVILREIFNEEYEIIEVNSGEEALEVIQAKAHDIELVLLDLVMGIQSGFAVL